MARDCLAEQGSVSELENLKRVGQHTQAMRVQKTCRREPLMDEQKKSRPPTLHSALGVPPMIPSVPQYYMTGSAPADLIFACVEQLSIGLNCFRGNGGAEVFYTLQTSTKFIHWPNISAGPSSTIGIFEL
jgi:hypothetical protein